MIREDLELIAAAALEKAGGLDQAAANPHSFVSPSSSAKGVRAFVANMRAEAAEIRAAVARVLAEDS